MAIMFNVRLASLIFFQFFADFNGIVEICFELSPKVDAACRCRGIGSHHCHQIVVPRAPKKSVLRKNPLLPFYNISLINSLFIYTDSNFFLIFFCSPTIRVSPSGFAIARIYVAICTIVHLLTRWFGRLLKDDRCLSYTCFADFAVSSLLEFANPYYVVI